MLLTEKTLCVFHKLTGRFDRRKVNILNVRIITLTWKVRILLTVKTLIVFHKLHLSLFLKLIGRFDRRKVNILLCNSGHFTKKKHGGLHVRQLFLKSQIQTHCLITLNKCLNKSKFENLSVACTRIYTDDSCQISTF